MKHLEEGERELANPARPRVEQGFKIEPQDLIRQFRFDYGNIWNGTHNNTVNSTVIMPLLDQYFYSNGNFSADMDYRDYSILKGTDFETEEMRAAYFYIKNRPLGYYVDFPNPQYIIIKIKVNPCAGRVDDLCCDGTSEAVCGDNTIITSGTDIGIAWFTNGFVI